MEEQSAAGKVFISFRIKLVLVYTLLFTVLFVLIAYWLHAIAVDFVVRQISEDLANTLKGATENKILSATDTVQTIDGDELQALIAEVEPDSNGLTDDPRYWNQVKTLCAIRRIEPRASLYTYVLGENEGEMIFITSWGRCISETEEDFAFFKQSWFPERIEPNARGLKEIIFRDDSPDGCAYLTENCVPTAYRDEYGYWISAFGPIRNSNGEVVAALGVDFEANYLKEAQAKVLRALYVAFGLTYILLLVLVYAIAQFFAQPIVKLTKTAFHISAANYAAGMKTLDAVKVSERYPDEIGIMRNVIKTMINRIYQREKLLSKAVEQLKIQIDEPKRKQQVGEIVETEFFQSLRDNVAKAYETQKTTEKNKETDAI